MKYVVSLILLSVGFATFGLWSALSRVKEGPRMDLPSMDMTQGLNLKYSPVVRLHDRDSHRFFCSGTVVSRNYIITAGHCLEGRDKYRPSIDIYSATGKATKAIGTAVFYEERSDQGMVYGDFSEFNILEFSYDTTKIVSIFLDQDRMVLSCGFPYGGDLFCAPITGRHQFGFGFKALGEMYPGMSGGPVIDVLTNTVVAVNTSVLEPGVFLSPLTEILSNANIEVGK